jgi:hypothetical protein
MCKIEKTMDEFIYLNTRTGSKGPHHVCKGCDGQHFKSIIKKSNEIKRPNFYNIVKCPRCGSIRRRGVKSEQEQTGERIIEICYTCERKMESEYLKKQRERSEMLEQRFEDISCNLNGTCNILKAHHTVLSDDPERLTTEFCINLVCGPNGVNKYKKSRGLL